MLPPLQEILATARVVTLPMVSPFRGITAREAVLFEGTCGWGEFAPFVEYDDREASTWLRAGIEFAWQPTPEIRRTSIPVNATVPAVTATEVAPLLDLFPGCTTVKIKVAQTGQTLADDRARVAAVRDYLGPGGHIRVDANAGWSVPEALEAIAQLAPYGLEYVEQPCAGIEQLAQVRSVVREDGIRIAADESIRRVNDPLRVVRARAADVLVIKAAPLGGIRTAREIIAASGMPVVISSAIDTSVGLGMGAFLAASLPDVTLACGLGTASLLAGYVTTEPLAVHNGTIAVRRAIPDNKLLATFAAPEARRDWWLRRLTRCYALLSPSV